MRQKKDGQPKPTRRGCRAGKHIQKRVQLLGDRITDLIEKEKTQPDKICYAAFTAIVNQINHNDSEQAIFKRLQNETKENSSSCCPPKHALFLCLQHNSISSMEEVHLTISSKTRFIDRMH